MLDSFEKNHRHSHEQNRIAVIPTAEKLGVEPNRSGKGIRIAFLDSGFYPHPDFADRVIAYHDIADEQRSLDHIITPAAHHWHGTQTVTTCAGDGRLSDGIYHGLAHKAELVLVKVSRSGRIGDSEIEAGLKWVLENRDRLNIRILNVSLGGDLDLATRESRINRIVEELTASGVVVTVAAGNSEDAHSTPPASAPSAITVGGYSDQNQFATKSYDLYHSNSGVTTDGLVKPDLLAPAMYVAAPILPGTREYESAEFLSMLARAPAYAFGRMLVETWESADLEAKILDAGFGEARRLIESELQRRKIVSTHYQHVDGTSFAAPIAASVIALMFEANPNLTPHAVKNVLVSTAARLGGHPAIRQGFGVINAHAALEMARMETHALESDRFHAPRIVGREIVFRFHDDTAARVSLAGDFNEWRSDPFEKCADGLWKLAIPCRPAGRYRYKFLIDDSKWTEDPSHALKEEDGFGGFNSVLVIGG